MKKTPNKKSYNKKHQVIELPSNNDEMEKYLDEHRKEINETMVDSIDYAVRKRMSTIEVFKFKNSNFIVVVNRKDFKENLENIFNFSLNHEHFEVCGKAKMVMEKMEKISHIFEYKKINNRYVKIKEIKKQKDQAE
jgi:hypothetical protein